MKVIRLLPLVFLLTSCYGWKTKIDNSSADDYDSSIDLADEEADDEDCQQRVSDEEYSESEILSSPVQSQISVGGNVVNVIINGKIYFWGTWYNNISDPEYFAAPVEIDFKDKVIDETPVAVYSGDMHGCGLFSSGRLFCWGDNFYGQLGNKTTYSSLEPKEIDMTGELKGKNVLMAALGRSHTCVLAGDGDGIDVYCWGDSSFGKLGLSDSATFVPIPRKVDLKVNDEADIIRIVAGEDFTCVIDDEGILYCWGKLYMGEYKEDYSEPFQPGYKWGLNERHLIDIAVGAEHVCVLDSRHRIFCMGNSNIFNILGMDANEGDKHFFEVVIEDSKGEFLETERLIAGKFFTCAIDKDGQTYCWGKSEDCCFKNEEEVSSNFPVMFKENTDLIKDGYISAGSKSICIKDRGSENVFCRGTNDSYKLGNGTTLEYSCELKEIALDSSLREKKITHVMTRYNITCASVDSKDVYCWGKTGGTDNYDEKSYSYLAPYHMITAEELGERKVVKIARGTQHSCYLDNMGDVYCGGDNSRGQLGYGTDEDSYSMDIPVKTGDMTDSFIVDISIGSQFTCAVDIEGSVYCWGYNSKGQLGKGDWKSSSVPKKVYMDSVLKGEKVINVNAGMEHVCALTDEKNVYCWGGNSDGQLGNGSFEDSPVPGKVDETGVLGGKLIEHIDTLFDHNCVIADDGYVYCWGRNKYGELGNGLEENSSVPVRALVGNEPDEIKSVMLSTGYSHTCSIDDKNDLYCWGYRDYSVQDRETFSSFYDIGKVMDKGDSSVYPIVSIDAGIGYTCFVNSLGELYCWGENHSGQLGNATATNSDLPVEVY